VPLPPARPPTLALRSEALRQFNAILHVIPLLVVESRKEAEEVRELVTIARDYNIALRIELKRREVKEDAGRIAELAAYFTHCNLQRVHLALSLRSAMSIFFKLKNYNTCATFCRRLLELQPDEKVGGGSGGWVGRADAGWAGQSRAGGGTMWHPPCIAALPACLLAAASLPDPPVHTAPPAPPSPLPRLPAPADGGAGAAGAGRLREEPQRRAAAQLRPAQPL
jgi:hypothetical protein